MIPAWFALGLAGPILAHLFPALSLGRDHNQTMIGFAVNLVIVGSLIF